MTTQRRSRIGGSDLVAGRGYVSRRSGARRSKLRAALLLIVVTMSTTTATAASRRSNVPLPRVTGPISGGMRTGLPQASPIFDTAAYGYTENEYFIEGTATSAGDIAHGPYYVERPGDTPPQVGTKAAYKTRIDVVLPPAEHYNGWVVVEWANVTLQYDVMYAAFHLHDYLMREGYGMAFVSAQKQGVDGSPLSLTSWDPQRYGSLVHPGDAYSYDIFSQAVAALRNGSKLKVNPMGGLRVRRVVAVGASQSCGALDTYLSFIAAKTRVVDGFLQLICPAHPLRGKRVVPDNVAPALWVNSESESGGATPGTTNQTSTDVPGQDGRRFRIWEVAGTSHVENYAMTQAAATAARDFSSWGGSPVLGVGWNANAERQYGERGSRPCLNLFPMHYASNAAMDALRRWILTDRAPASTRFARDASGNVLRDGNGNILGGVRLPPIMVPVATYQGTDCGPLDGSTYKFDAAKLAELYPTHGDYVRKMAAATRFALSRRWLLRPEAREMMSLAQAAPIPI